MKKITNTTGSVALMSILIIAAFSLILVLGMAETSNFTSLQGANNSAQKSAYYHAEACLEESMRRLKSDTSFSEATLTFDAQANCVIAVLGDAIKQITITTTYDDVVQVFSAQVSLIQNGTATNIRLLSWSKI